MKNSRLLLIIPALVSLFALSVTGCRKINEYTELGGGLIPPVDNIHTFDSTLSVQVFNDTFTSLTDSLRITANADHFLGHIQSDPFFGQTEARLYLQLKPSEYAKYPFARPDSVTIDSVVLVLSYADTYGDTNIVQNIRVYEMNQSNDFRYDSAYLVRQENFLYNVGPALNDPFSSSLVWPRNLDDSVKVFKDTTAGQMRLRLDTNLARRFFNYDTTNAYKSDSIFNTRFKGFALRSESGGNAMMRFKLADFNTKLAFYYHHPKIGGGGNDTTVSYFNFYNACAGASYVRRDYAGSSLAAVSGSALPANFAYIQKNPGSFAMIKIPDLAGLSNRLVHRAELIAEQVFDVSDNIFPPNGSLYLDALDPSISDDYKYRSIPYSLDFFPTTGFDFKALGTAPKDALDGASNKIKVWKFDLTRYVQNILNGKQTSYDLRLYAPLFIKGKTRNAATGIDFDLPLYTLFVNDVIANGRVRLGGGNHPAQRMRLRIIYSKL